MGIGEHCRWGPRERLWPPSVFFSSHSGQGHSRYPHWTGKETEVQRGAAAWPGLAWAAGNGVEGQEWLLSLPLLEGAPRADVSEVSASRGVQITSRDVQITSRGVWPKDPSGRVSSARWGWGEVMVPWRTLQVSLEHRAGSTPQAQPERGPKESKRKRQEKNLLLSKRHQRMSGLPAAGRSGVRQTGGVPHTLAHNAEPQLLMKGGKMQ